MQFAAANTMRICKEIHELNMCANLTFLAKQTYESQWSI